jgi:hypothetical protein
MDLKPEGVSAISRYIFDYIVGIIWIAAGIVWVVSSAWFSSAGNAISRLASVKSSLQIPDFVIGFLLAIGGVVLPYCVSVVLKPATLGLMGLLQRAERRFRRWRASRHPSADKEPSIDLLAGKRIEGELQCARAYIGREVRVTFAHVRVPSVAPYVTAIEEEVYFRATAVLPSALLVGGMVYRLPIALHLALSAGATSALLLFGAWASNWQFRSWMLTVNTVVLLAPDGAPKSHT